MPVKTERKGVKKSFGGRPLVTVFSDASYDQASKVSGHHIWMRNSVRKVEDTFTRQDIPNSSAAEVLGLATALDVAVREFTGACDFVLQCDSTEALGAFLTFGGSLCRQASTSKVNVPFLTKDTHKAAVISVIRKISGRVWLKHVKGHTNNVDARSYINRMNDEKARLAMRRFIGATA